MKGRSISYCPSKSRFVDRKLSERLKSGRVRAENFLCWSHVNRMRVEEGEDVWIGISIL